MMNTYLFTWNPKKWDWVDLQDSVNQLKTDGYFERRWGCGRSKKIQKGDRIFLIKLGEEPKGIIGSGYAKSSYYIDDHWNGIKGKTAHYVDVRFDVLIHPDHSPILDRSTLETIDINGVQQWFPQQSKPEIIERLEANWRNFVEEYNHD